MNPYGLIFGGLLLLITVVTPSLRFFSDFQIADKEIARKAQLEDTMDYMCQQLEQLAIVDILPENLEQRDVVINRAMDVHSASMLFLALSIQHDSTSFSIPGTFFPYVCITF